MSQQPETERAVLLRWYELCLLCCTLTSSPPSDSPPSPPQPQSSDHHRTHSSLLNYLFSSIEAGDYLRTLSSDASALVLRQLADDKFSSSSSADRVYSELLRRVESFLVLEPEDDEDKAYRALLVVSITVAAFLTFAQCNMTGPLKEMAKCPLALKKVGGKGEDEELVEWENWACNQLMATGSNLLGKFSNLQVTLL